MEELEFEITVPTRYTYYFNDEINMESVQGLIDVLVNYSAVDLFFTTYGGEGSTMRILIHFINNHPDIKIYLINHIMSAGTFFLIGCDKEVILHDELEIILFHMGDREVEGQFRKRKINSDILYEQLKFQNEEMGKKFEKLGLTKKEMKMYNDGDDVILYKKDFHRLKINKN